MTTDTRRDPDSRRDPDTRRGRRRRRARSLTVGVLLALAGLLGAEALVAANRDYLTEVDFRVRATVGPDDPAAGQPLRLWVLGDSTAAGVGVDDEATSLPVQLARLVAEAAGRQVMVTGLGVSGARTDDVTVRQVPELPPAGAGAPDVVVVLVGSNDVTHLTPPWELDDRTVALLRAVRDRTQAPVVLGGIPRFSGVGALPEPLRSVTDQFARVQRERQREAVADVEGARFVDIAALASPRFAGRPGSMSSDDFHPSALGYRFWAEALAPAVLLALETDS